jgi:hypothetical protein
VLQGTLDLMVLQTLDTRAGRVEGTPADLVAAKSTLTGEHLAAFVGGRPKAARSR